MELGDSEAGIARLAGDEALEGVVSFEKRSSAKLSVSTVPFVDQAQQALEALVHRGVRTWESISARTSAEYLPYTDSSVWHYPADSWFQHQDKRLYDVTSDPAQRTNFATEEPIAADRLASLLERGLEDLDTPKSQWSRLGL